MYSVITWLAPWDFSPTVLVVCLLFCGLYVAGMWRCRCNGAPAGFWRSSSFFIGLALVYAVLQTHFDYYAQHMFWIHRLQHLVLHHLAPFLIMLAVPHAILANGIPARIRHYLKLFWQSRGVQIVYRLIQHPFIAALFFVGLIYYWLIPSVHFEAMLDATLYNVMNWSMLLDGLLFWWLILDPRSPAEGARTGFGMRLLLLWVIMIPQLLLGAYIGLSTKDLYTVYAVCGRIWPISPITDQHIGGLITWIPSCMMSAVGALIVFKRWTRYGRELPRVLQSPLALT